MSKTFGLYGSKAHPRPVPLSGQAGQESNASTPCLRGSRSRNTVGPRRRHSSGANQSWILSTVTTLSLNNKVCFSETLKSLSDAKASSCLPRSWRTITEPYFLIRSASKVAKRSFEQFAINYVQIGLNGACCNGSPQALRSWWGYDTPILA